MTLFILIFFAPLAAICKFVGMIACLIYSSVLRGWYDMRDELEKMR